MIAINQRNEPLERFLAHFAKVPELLGKLENIPPEEKKFIVTFLCGIIIWKTGVLSKVRKFYDDHHNHKTIEELKKTKNAFFQSMNKMIEEIEIQFDDAILNLQKYNLLGLENHLSKIASTFKTIVKVALSKIESMIKAAVATLSIVGLAALAGGHPMIAGSIIIGSAAAAIAFTYLNEGEKKVDKQKLENAKKEVEIEMAKIENGLNFGLEMTLQILVNNKDFSEKQIFLFLSNNNENKNFYGMMKENFPSMKVFWLTNSSKIKELSTNRHKFSPYVIITSSMFYSDLEPMLKYDPMLQGLIIYTSNIKNFVEKDQHPDWKKDITISPYDVFERTKVILENLKQKNGTYFYHVYYLAAKFGNYTYNCLSAENLHFKSLEQVPIFSWGAIYELLKRNEFVKFREKFQNYLDKCTPESFESFVAVFSNDLCEFQDLMDQHLPKEFLNYLSLFPINPLDPFYDTLFSTEINESMNSSPKNVEKEPNKVKREALRSRKNYMELVFKLMEILNNKAKNETWKIKKILNLYTVEKFCREINKYFFIMNPKILEHFKNLLGIFYYAFAKFEDESKIPQKLYRGVKFEDLQEFQRNHKVNDRIVFPQFLSTTTKMEVARQMGNILFEINNKGNFPKGEKPRNMKDVSEFKKEAEFLWKCFSCFEIIKIEKTVDGFDFKCTLNYDK